MNLFSKALLTLLVLPTLAIAENVTRTAGYAIHHNALTTDSLPAQVASAYGLQRSSSQGLLNVSVIKEEPGRPGQAVRADVKAVARTLWGQMREIKLREIVEDKAIYYIGDFPVSHLEMLRFDLEVMPEGARYPLNATMRHEFYTK